MTPEQIHDEWMTAALASFDGGSLGVPPANQRTDIDNALLEDGLRIGIAAVLPLHEKQLRERIAAEIEAYADVQLYNDNPAGARVANTAADIATGDYQRTLT